MRSSLSKNLFFFSFPSCSYSFSSSPARALLLRLQVCHFSASPNYGSFPHSPHYSRRLEDESRNVRVSVWWDFENCHPPVGVSISRIAPAITEAVRANGIKGPIQITAFGDVLQLSKANQETLACTGIQLTHVPNGGKNSADRSLLVDLMYWVSQNPPPAHLFLISGDRDFAGVLHRLRMNNYNILLASPGKASDVLRSAATIMWQWPSLLKGEDLTGKRFNHPPDGPYGSWYGNYRIPLENPFSASEQSASVKNVEIGKPTQDSPAPNLKAVERHVRSILSSHPKGFPISTLRSELAKCNVHLDKSLFGYKKLSLFLSSMPHVQLKDVGDGNFCVCLIPPESSRHLVSNDGPSMTSTVNNEEGVHVTALKLNGEGKTVASDADVMPSIASLHESISEKVEDVADAQLSETHLPPEGNEAVTSDADVTPSIASLHERSSENVEDVADAQLSETHLSPEGNEVSKSKVDFTKMSSEKLPDDEIVGPEDVNPNNSGKYTTLENHSAGNDYMRIENSESENFIAEDKYERPTKKDADEVCHGPSFLPVDDSLVNERPGENAETYSKSSTFFGWIRSWWPSCKSSAKSDDLTAHQIKEVSHSEEPKLSELDQTISHAEEAKLFDEEPKLSQLDQNAGHSVEPKLSQLDQTVGRCVEPKLSELDQNVLHPEEPELFSRDSFWNDMESFVFTPKGSHLFSSSTSREDLAQSLQKNGPRILRYLTVKDSLQLVDLLIADKKWLEESPFQVNPFMVTRPVKKSSLAGLSPGANGLRSLFLSKTSDSSSQKSSEHDAEKHNQNIPCTRVPAPSTKAKYDKRSRSDILADCQKLVNEILREHPDGYNIGCFRKLFVERYGYDLEVQKLGYKKLASLLQTMTAASVKSSHIFPSVPVCDFDLETSILKTQVTDASHAVSSSDGELSDAASKYDNNDSPWEELGPVSVNNSNQSDLDSLLSREAKELNTSSYPDYEPIGSDYDSSESEGDNSCLTKPVEDGKPRIDEQDSPFLQLLDLWGRSKEGENSIKKSDKGDVLENSMDDMFNSSLEQTRLVLSKIPSGNYREKQRSQKTYSFVADSRLPQKDKLIDVIKKENKSKMQI